MSPLRQRRHHDSRLLSAAGRHQGRVGQLETQGLDRGHFVQLDDHPTEERGRIDQRHTAERAELTEISINKLVDLATPMLAQSCACGKTSFPKARLEFMRADGQGEPIKYFEVELENVLIGHVAPSFAALRQSRPSLQLLRRGQACDGRHDLVSAAAAQDV
jgi:type VI secretion system Hcp family effector